MNKVLILFVVVVAIVMLIGGCAQKQVPKQIVKDNVTLDAYVPCGKGGVLIKYDECENPQDYKLVFYGTTDLDAFLSEQYKKAVTENNTELCKGLKDNVRCIAIIAKKLENKSICDKAMEQKGECLKSYEEIAFFKTVPSWREVESGILLDGRDLHFLRVFGYLPEQKYLAWYDEETEKKVDELNEEIKKYNSAIKTNNETNCFELVLLKNLCAAHIAKLKKQKLVCDRLNNANATEKCYEIYDNLELNKGPTYCEDLGNCRLMVNEGFINDSDRSPCYGIWNVGCQENKCVWVCKCLGDVCKCVDGVCDQTALPFSLNTSSILITGFGNLS